MAGRGMIQIFIYRMFPGMNWRVSSWPPAVIFEAGKKMTGLPFLSVSAVAPVYNVPTDNNRSVINIISPVLPAGAPLRNLYGYLAEENLVRLPDTMDFVTAAVLGCRFITSWRGVTAQGAIKAGDFIAVHGCGGVGLSAIMIAAAMGAVPIAIDIDNTKLEFAKTIGAAYTINAREIVQVPDAVITITKGGAQVSVDALGSWETCKNSIRCLCKQGKHIQLGLMAGAEANPPLPMHEVIAKELQLIGSHGMQAHQYPKMMEWISSGKMHPEKLLGKIITLEESCEALTDLDSFRNTGVTVIRLD